MEQPHEQVQETIKTTLAQFHSDMHFLYSYVLRGHSLVDDGTLQSEWEPFVVCSSVHANKCYHCSEKATRWSGLPNASTDPPILVSLWGFS